MNHSSLAPIALFVYNRLAHTQKTVEALQKNLLARESELFIFSDGAKNPGDSVSNAAVNEVRAYIHSIQGFKKVTVVERNRNYGLAQSIITGVTEIVQKYGKIIVVEDDIVTSLYFLTYMNESLHMYEHDEQVASIHGYIYAINQKLPETFFLRGTDCWGWATWKRAWNVFEQDGAKLLRDLDSNHMTKDFDFGGSYPYSDMLRAQIAGKNDSWAVRWYASAFLKNMLTLYPGISLVDNIGHDTSGTHSKKTSRYRTTVSNRKIQVERIPLVEDSRARRLFAEYLKPVKQNFMSKIFGEIQKQKYNPKFLGLLVNPFYFVRRALYENMRDLSGHIHGKVLDVGCGTKPYEKLFTKATEYIGMDYDSPENRRIKQIDVFYDTKSFPFGPETFDGIIFTQVLEHVFNPDEFLAEIHRTLKKGGTILMSVPFVWDEHSQPYDYARYSSFGVAHLLKNHGFTIIEHRKTLNDVRVIFQLINCYIYKTLPFKNYYIRLVSNVILISPFTILGKVLSLILPKNADLYMDNIIVAKK